MKKAIFIISIFLILVSVIIYSSFSSNLTNNNESNSKISLESVFQQNHTAKSALLELLNYFKIEHDGTLHCIVDKTQKEWLRKAGKERWEIEEIKIEDKNKVMKCFSDIGCINQIKARHNEYDHVLILGALSPRIKLRTATALKMWLDGIKFKNLIFLGGQRPRDLEQETKKTFILSKKDKDLTVKKDWKFNGVLPNTETEIMKLIFEQIDLSQDFIQNVTVTFVDTPMQKNKDGSLRRPNTADTIIEWLKTNPIPGKCIFISNNPYVGYQHSVVGTYMPKEFTFETIGDSASPQEKIAIYLDTIARWLYQEQQRLISKNKEKSN